MQEPDNRTRIAESFARQAMMKTFGAELGEVSPGRCEIIAPLFAGALQQHGTAHAALTFALGDTAAGYAALTMLPEGREVMTAEMKINLLSPAVGERLIATGQAVKVGRRLAVVTAQVETEDAAGNRKLIAVLQGTIAPVDPA